MKVWISAAGDSECVRVHFHQPRKSLSGDWGWAGNFYMMMRVTARKIFGKLPRHGSRTLIEGELTFKPKRRKKA